MIGVPWGSQIRASKVDTGSRGRGKPAKKRKAEEALQAGQDDQSSEATKSAAAVVAASSGFVHILQPTPENWTTSLPHRTQVVYTPDYSYILHRIRARPGSRLIEAGSGSGSFTHAAARAVFNGYQDEEQTSRRGEDGDATAEVPAEKKSFGKVFSYEFHAERHQKVQVEMAEHGLATLVHATHRDVYKDGFLVNHDAEEKISPRANAIFLDLPAPWEALPHLVRDENAEDSTRSALDPQSAVHICTFSPCIEQAQKTISALRRYDWLDIEMVEMQHKRIEVRREYTGLDYEGMRGTNLFAADVQEAVSKLREVEQRARDFHAASAAAGKDAGGKQRKQPRPQQDPNNNKPKQLPFDGGKLVHRTEPELKTHTSYLVFAVLPRAWTDSDEAAAQARWSRHVQVASNVPKSQRQLKKEAKQQRIAAAVATTGKDNDNPA
jgi:tRNA (adenine57-N1/adenine58-N1)-methyltransferase